MHWNSIVAEPALKSVAARLAKPSGATHFMEFDPAEARDFASQLVAAADAVERKADLAKAGDPTGPLTVPPPAALRPPAGEAATDA